MNNLQSFFDRGFVFHSEFCKPLDDRGSDGYIVLTRRDTKKFFVAAHYIFGAYGDVVEISASDLACWRKNK